MSVLCFAVVVVWFGFVAVVVVDVVLWLLSFVLPFSYHMIKILKKALIVHEKDTGHRCK